MPSLRYTVIKNDDQYDSYCDRLEELVQSGLNGKEAGEEYELLYLLISDYEEKYRIRKTSDPVALIRSLMKDHDMNQTDLAEVAGVGKSYVSEILNYKKKMSKQVIRKIAEHFKIRQDALNRPYELNRPRAAGR